MLPPQGVQHRTINNVQSTKPKNWFKFDLCATLIRAIIIASNCLKVFRMMQNWFGGGTYPL